MWLHRSQPSSGRYSGHVYLSRGGQPVFSCLHMFYLNHALQTLPNDLHKEKDTIVSTMPTIYKPQSHYETPGEGLTALCQQVYFSGHVWLQLVRNDTAFPGHICTDRWCKRTNIALAPSAEPARNANGICGEVKQGKLRTDSKI